MAITPPPSTKPLSLPVPDHTRTLFRSRLSSALRTALACTLVGASTLYTPSTLHPHHHLLKFPAFSYVTAVLILADSATLGDALRGAAQAIYATVLGLLPAMLTMYAVRPAGVSASTAAVAVVVSSFVVVVSDSGLTTTRVALGQIVLVFVAAFDSKPAGHGHGHGHGHGSPVLHLLPVAVSTAVGVVAAVLALVVPYPRLACYEASKKSKLYSDIARERLRLFLNAYCADNSSCMAASISQAKSLGRTSTKLLQSIKVLQGSMQWERPPFNFLPPYNRVPADKLQAIETSLKGMELALASTTSLPKTIKLDQLQLKDDDILTLQHQMSIKLKQEINSKAEITDHCTTLDKTLQSFQILLPNPQDLPPLFFLFCMKLLFDDAKTLTPPPSQAQKSKPNSCEDQEDQQTTKKPPSFIWNTNLTTKKLLIAFKCSLTLALAVFLGLLFSKENGYWSGLTVAITFSPSSDSTFRLATARAHGTAIGSVFGVFGSLVSQHLMEVRLLSLVPWLVFTSFLQRSRMYGQPGAVAAALSAMIIVGRRDYGSPIMFTINRLTETYIGLCCAILVEILLQPARASTVARGRLSESLKTVRECVGSTTSPADLKEKEKKLKATVRELRKCVQEAELEPNFWFLPFPVACYNKLLGSLAKMGDFLVFLVHGMEMLTQEYSCEIEGSLIMEELDQCKELIGDSLKCLEDVMQVKSLERLEKELWARKETMGHDVEEGKGPSPFGHWALSEKVVLDSLLQHSREVLERFDDEDVSGELKRQLVLCFATIGFCVGGLMREMREIEKGVLELVQWENPSSYVNLSEISSKIKEISTC